MEQKHVENLSTLIRFMESLNDPRFDMGHFTHNCGSPACALGWASTLPALMNAGMCDVTKARYDAIVGSALSTFGDYRELFSSLNTNLKTPQAWANHARAYLKRHGRDVVPADDGFESFMRMALKPVLVEQRA